MPNPTAVPLQVILCHSSKDDSWGLDEPVARQLELLLVGDPDRPRPAGRDWQELAEAIPLADEISLFSYSKPPGDPAGAGAFLDDALHTVVVALVDPDLLREEAFLDWLAACAAHPGTRAGRHRLVAAVRGDETKEAWEKQSRRRPKLGHWQSLDFSQGRESAERLDWLGLRLLFEMLQVTAQGAGAPAACKPQIFVSHTKRGGLSVAKALRDLVGQVPWLESFYDARDLGTRCPWERQLEEAVASSVLVALRTDQFDQRPWCQQEIRWAEQYGVPMLVVDARQGIAHATSHLPFESAPAVRIPDGNLVRVLHAALRVAVKAQVFKRWVKESLARGTSWRVISVPPTLAAVATACDALERLDPPRRLYCPGPLEAGLERAAQALAERAGVDLISPSTEYRRRLGGHRVGISVSESDDLAAHGQSPAGVNRLTVALSRALLRAGARLAFGHDWRRDGIMNALCTFALEERGLAPTDATELAILNLLPWPDETAIPLEILKRLEGVVEIQPAGLPSELVLRHPGPASSLDEVTRSGLRASALTHLRQSLVEQTVARVCVGGKRSGFSGHYPGVLEEARLTLQAAKPVYFLGLLGGVAEEMGRAILDGAAFDKSPGGQDAADLDQAYNYFRHFGADDLAALNGLTVEQNRLLLETRFEEEALALVLRGVLGVVGRAA